jgi:hypothetical protein
VCAGGRIAIADIRPGFIRESVKLVGDVAGIRDGVGVGNMAHAGSSCYCTCVLIRSPGVDYDNAGVGLQQGMYLLGGEGTIEGKLDRSCWKRRGGSGHRFNGGCWCRFGCNGWCGIGRGCGCSYECRSKCRYR